MVINAEIVCKPARRERAREIDGDIDRDRYRKRPCLLRGREIQAWHGNASDPFIKRSERISCWEASS